MVELATMSLSLFGDTVLGYTVRDMWDQAALLFH